MQQGKHQTNYWGGEMTDKQIIETLKNIKNYCDSKSRCHRCKFKIKPLPEDAHVIKQDCQIIELLEYLSKQVAPTYWEIEKIERIVKQ